MIITSVYTPDSDGRPEQFLPSFTTFLLNALKSAYADERDDGNVQERER